MSQKEAIAKAPPTRVRRTTLGTRNVLTVQGKDPNYHYRVVNDDSDRVNEFLDNGWETVDKSEVRIGDKRLGNPSTDGSVAKAHVGRGMQAYILKIRKDWYEEDQAAKQSHVDATESATKEKALDGTYGKLEISRS